MGLFEDLQQSLKQAMLDKDEIKRETLRMVISGVKNRRIELGRDLTDDDVLAVITKAVKSRQDSMEQFAKAGRDELAHRLTAWVPLAQAELIWVLGPRAPMSSANCECPIASSLKRNRRSKW